MDFVENKAGIASYDDSFHRNLPGVCQKCILHCPEKDEFRAFLEELFQLYFLKKEDSLDENERNILKTLFLNNQQMLLICYQL